MKNKKKLANSVLSFFFGFFDRKKNIVFVVPASFHAEHLYPVIDALMLDKSVRLHLVGPFNKSYGSGGVKHYDSYDGLSLFYRYSLFILTGLNLPWQFEGKTVFFGHGIGPKLKYQISNEIKQFDYVFAPCSSIFEVQKNLGPEVFKVGLPLLDKFTSPRHVSSELSALLAMEVGKPTLCYAPSWSNNELIISDIELALKYLTQLNDFNVIVSPHPNLLDRSKYSKSSIFETTPIQVNGPNSGVNTLDLCAVSAIVISDISSILYEALALKKSVFFDGNQKIYSDSDAIRVLDELTDSMPTIKWNEFTDSSLTLAYRNYDHIKSQEFINAYLFNSGSASKVALSLIMDIIK